MLSFCSWKALWSSRGRVRHFHKLSFLSSAPLRSPNLLQRVGRLSRTVWEAALAAAEERGKPSRPFHSWKYHLDLKSLPWTVQTHWMKAAAYWNVNKYLEWRETKQLLLWFNVDYYVPIKNGFVNVYFKDTHSHSALINKFIIYKNLSTVLLNKMH